MSRFLMDRSIFENDIWYDPLSFRLFFFLVGRAAFKDGVKQVGFVLKRGQFLRSYRKLQEDLQYVQDRTIKTPSLSCIKRSVDRLVKEERIRVEKCELGTLFTVLNYEAYQAFPGAEPGGLDVPKKQQGNGEETTAEQPKNHKNQDKACRSRGSKHPKTSKHLVPDDWQPGEPFHHWLRDKHPTVGAVEFELELDRFKSYCKANDRKYADHDAAFRNWFNSPFRKNKAQVFKGTSVPGADIAPSTERSAGSLAF